MNGPNDSRGSASRPRLRVVWSNGWTGGAGREEIGDDALQAYVDYLHGEGLAPATVRIYRGMIARARKWAEEEGVDLLDMSASEVVALRAQFPESAGTLRQLRSSLQHYWDMHRVGYPPIKALRVPKKPRPVWRGLSDDIARQLARTAYGWHPEGTATLIGLYTGLRRAEIAAMRWDRFSPGLERYTVTGKGGVTDTVPIHPRLRSILRPLRGGYVWLFPGQRRLHVSAATVWTWVTAVAEEAGVYVTPHQLRHTIISGVARAAAAQGLDGLRVAQKLARHARADTTQVYLEGITAAQVEAALEVIDWLGKEPAA